jgi:hypothetical protein
MSIFPKHKLMTVCFLSQNGETREEVILARILPWGVFIGKAPYNEFIPMHRVLRVFIHR